jgi:hemerythrin
MDMRVQLPSGLFVDVDLRTPATEYASLAEHRRRVFALIGDFQRAVAQPKGLQDALRVLKEILPCSDAYFSLIESMLDKISAAGATPHRDDHRRILTQLKETLDRYSTPGPKRATPDLVHALDSLVMHETAIRLREFADAAATR